jgi:hypothetical protein
MFEKMFEKKFAKKVRKYYKLSEGRGGEGWGGERGELSFQCLRPSSKNIYAQLPTLNPTRLPPY